MGMYTELVLKVELKENLPAKVAHVLSYMLMEIPNPPDVLPNHPFFLCPRWQRTLCNASHYHHPVPVHSRHTPGYTNSDYLFVRADFKNYHNEIGHFLDWLFPYVEDGCYDDTGCIGWVWYEEWDHPRLILRDEQKIWIEKERV